METIWNPKFEQYRKKPIVIEAYRYDLSYSTQVETLEGAMTVNPGDWVIKGVKGELYPCKDDIFQMTYEKVEKTDRLEQFRNLSSFTFPKIAPSCPLEDKA